MALSSNVSSFIRSILFILVALALLFYQSWKLSLFIVSTFIPIAFIVSLFGLTVKSIQRELQAAKADLASIAQEVLGNIRTVKTFSTEEL